jgi:type II restriction/modification system DNA methylase subunit YeeA
MTASLTDPGSFLQPRFDWERDTVAALYEAPFAYSLEHIQPVRSQNKRKAYADYWWRHVEPRQGMFAALGDMAAWIVTPTVAKHRLFAKLHSSTVPDHQLIAIARDDNTTFGILHSRFHELWSLRMGTSLEDRPRYTPTTTFETFPFPEGLTPDIAASDYADDPRAQKVAEAAARLNELRENWLNPPDLVRREPEVVAGYPDRILPVDEAAAQTLKTRTLTKLYNARPAWLDHAHRALDEAVANAYGWPSDLSDDDILAKLLALNQARAGK